jgi:hypothetical protein
VVLTLVFGGWVIVVVLRLVGRILGGLFAPAPAPRAILPVIRCGHPKCRATNPGRARFCRRCGKMLQLSDPAVARKVAMW